MATKSQIQNKAFRETLKAKRAWKPADGRRKTHQEPAWERPTDIEHPLDDDILASLKRGQMKAEVLVDLFSVDLDAAKGTFHFRWEDADIADMWAGIVNHSMDTLTEAEPSGDLYLEELEWIASTEFEEVCQALGFDPWVLRASIPYKLRKAGRPLPANGEAKRLMDAFGRIVEHMSFDMNKAEVLTRFQ